MFAMLRHYFRVAQANKRELEKEARSPKWRTVRDHHLASEPRCRACQSVVNPQVHHIQPFSMHPELELEPTNLMTLCMDVNECHLIIGHGGHFQYDNLNVVKDVEEIRQYPTRRQLVEDRAREKRVKEREKAS